MTERVTTEQAVAWARAHGAVPHVVDGGTLRTAQDALTAIGEALDFPPYYGGTLDALYDCLSDLSWLAPGRHVLIWSHHQALAGHDWAGYQQVRATLRDGAVTSGARRLTVVLTTA
ncbi:MAG TPA: barstar family protein [Pseudonocardiaceae bacterium]